MTIVITGASSGIGEGFAKALAAQGHALLLVARNQNKLAELRDSLTALSAANIEFFCCDLANESELANLLAHLQTLPLTGVINCAGIGHHGEFKTVQLAQHQQLNLLNMSALMAICHATRANLAKQKGAYIINVASTAAFQAGPNMANYYASKAYVLSLSQGLHEEYKQDGITVSCLCPGFTASSFFSNSNMSADKVFASGIMAVERVVASALANKHQAVVIPGKRNYLGTLFSKWLPMSMTRKIAAKLQGK